MKRQDKIIENLLVAQAMVMDLPNRKFTPALCEFANDKFMDEGPHACGSAACFGGWVAVHPHFQKQGVKPTKDGSPRNRTSFWSHHVSTELFGNDLMFEASSWADTRDEKREVLDRIKEALEDAIIGNFL